MERLLVPLATVLTAGSLAAQTSVSVPPQSPRSAIRFSYELSALPALWSQGGLGPVEVDTSVGGPAAGDGGPLTIGGRTFRSGLGTHATSAIAYDLDGSALAFGSWIGVDDAVGANGSVVFEVQVDGVVAYTSGLLTGADGPVHTGRIDVAGAHELLLVVRDGGDGAQDDHANWADATVFATTRPVGDGTRLRATRGDWEPVMPWPLDPIQAVLLDTGDLLTSASQQADGPGDDSPGAPHDGTRADLSDPATFGHTAVDHPTEEVFGAALARLSDGTLLAAGGFGGRVGSGAPIGQDQASRFDSAELAWIPAANGPLARWGASGITLGDGSLLAVGGVDGNTGRDASARFDGASWTELPGASLASWLDVGDPRLDGTFPYLHLAPDGQVLVAGWGETYGLLDTRGMGTWTFQAQREPIERAFGAAASVAPETLLLTGGVDYVAGVPGEAARTAITVDLSGGTPAVVPTGAMTFARADHDATVLADGSVLVSGGDRFHAEDGAPTAVRVPEAWDPGTGLFTIYAAASEPRGYRSTAVLLPDGRVWTGGGACGAGCTSNLTAEVFRPPYLFAPDGQLAVRPTLTSASSTALYGASFDLSVAGGTPISRITAVRAGAATHGVDADQRFLELSFTQSGSSLDVESPVNGDVAPPGPYLVFAFDANGVPSVARIVRFGEPTPSAWEFVVTSDGSLATGRHEAAIANVGGKLYLMGGRGARPTEEYDTVARTWRQLGLPPFEIHHFQPVVIDGLVYVIGAHTGPFPNEANVARIWTYDPTTDDWAQGPQIPAARRRGSGGTFVRDGKIYLLCGNNQGHNGGARAWFDEYDPVTQAWTVLPDAPRARDHFQTALIGDRLVVSGGRATTLPNPFDGTIGEVDIYDFSTGTWSTVAQAIPTQRAGTMTVQIGRYAVVVGGESDAMTAAHRDVEAFDALSEEWTILPPLVRGRHSGGMGVVDGRIYVASGSGNAGGTPELPSSEALDGAGVLDDLDANLVENGDFSAGFAGWLSGGSSQLVPEGGIAAPGALVQSGNLRRVFPAQAGVTYSVRLLYTATGGGASSVELFARDGGGSNLASTSSGLGPATTLSLGSVDWLAPPGTESILVRISASGGRTLLVDDVVVTD